MTLHEIGYDILLGRKKECPRPLPTRWERSSELRLAHDNRWRLSTRGGLVEVWDRQKKFRQVVFSSASPCWKSADVTTSASHTRVQYCRRCWETSGIACETSYECVQYLFSRHPLWFLFSKIYCKKGALRTSGTRNRILPNNESCLTFCSIFLFRFQCQWDRDETFLPTATKERHSPRRSDNTGVTGAHASALELPLLERPVFVSFYLSQLEGWKTDLSLVFPPNPKEGILDFLA